MPPAFTVILSFARNPASQSQRDGVMQPRVVPRCGKQPWVSDAWSCNPERIVSIGTVSLSRKAVRTLKPARLAHTKSKQITLNQDSHEVSERINRPTVMRTLLSALSPPKPGSFATALSLLKALSLSKGRNGPTSITSPLQHFVPFVGPPIQGNSSQFKPVQG
jgi:hypothetical protein